MSEYSSIGRLGHAKRGVKATYHFEDFDRLDIDLTAGTLTAWCEGDPKTLRLADIEDVAIDVHGLTHQRRD